jgi:hypothetical protein
LKAVDVDARMMPGENPLGPLRTEKLPANKEGQHLAGEDFDEPGIEES